MITININRNIGEKKKKGQLKFLLLIISLTILYSHGFSYVYWNSTYGGWVNNIVAILFMLFLVFNWPKGKTYHFKTEALLILLIPFCSIWNTHSLYSQGYIDSIKTLSGCFVWVFYFFLHKYKVQESTILKAFLIMALFIVVVQVVQQFTYPNAPFGTYNEDTMIAKGMQEVAEQRNGLWRFRILNGYFTCIILFASVVWMRKRFDSKLLVLIALMLISIYLTLTRQVMAACFLALFFSFFLGKKNKGYMQAVLIGIVIVSLIYSYSDALFGSFAEQTKDDMSDSYVRVLAGTYFWNESISAPQLFLFGHGLPGQTGTFRILMQQLNEMMGFYTVDVGFIGMTYTFGAIYVILCFYLLWKLLFTHKKYMPVYVRLYVIYTGAMSIMIFPMSGTVHYLIWSSLMYVSDLHINRGIESEKNAKVKQNVEVNNG